MKIYVFGAGASLASQREKYPLTSEFKAPLIDELFDDRYKNFALYMLSPSELKEFRKEILERPDKSVENWLDEKWSEINSFKSKATRESKTILFGHIVMYIWNVLRRVSDTYNEENLYRLFLVSFYKKYDEDLGIINFNYDTLLDRAYEQVLRKNFTSIESYLKENVVKPHGSVNWLLEKRKSDPEVPKNHDTSTRIRMAMEQFFMNGPISMSKLRVLNPSIEQLRHTDIARAWEVLGMDYFYPLIFLPLTNKDLSHITDFYLAVIQKGADLLAQAEEIYVIGYRAKDKIIRELFRHAPMGTRLNVVSKSHAKEIADDILGWANNLQRGTETNEGFKTFIKEHFGPEI